LAGSPYALVVNTDRLSESWNLILEVAMTTHQLQYFRYLLRRMKDLYVEKEAMSCVLDSPKSSAGGKEVPWREAVARMRHDAVYCSAVEANFAPHFERVERALRDEDLLKQLQGLQEL
jgi:hypothetical protein